MVSRTTASQIDALQAQSRASSQTESSLSEDAIDVGRQLRRIRRDKGYSIRALAERSGLNVNTLSMIENGKSSPSVSTLQQLAKALGVTITAFFELADDPKKVVYQAAEDRKKASFAHGTLEDLGAGMTLLGAQPLLVVLEPGANSGTAPIVHTGIEFVFCLEGRLRYTIEEHSYTLKKDDSLMFEAHLPHRWENIGNEPSRSLLILYPSDERDRPTELHFATG